MTRSGDLSRRTESGYAVHVTEKLFYHDPSLLEFDASIIEHAQNGALHDVVLDRTCFFPGGGGQPADRGTLGGARVVDVKDRDGDIVHVLEAWPSPGPAARGAVHGMVDAARRRDFMAQHTGEHVLAQALLTAGGLSTVSVHFGDDTTTIELAVPSVGEDVLRRAEELANTIIMENRKVIVHDVDPSEASRFALRRTPPEVGRLRVVEIEGFDWVGCSGVHVPSTGRLFMIKVIGQEKIRGHARIHVLIGQRAFTDYSRKVVMTQTLTRSLTCGEEFIAARVEELVAGARERDRELKKLRVERAAADADTAVGAAKTFGDTRLISGVFDGVGADYLKAFAERVIASAGRVAVVLDRDAEAFQWIICHSVGSEVELPPIVTPLLASAGARGGGRGAWMQGAGKPAAAAVSFARAVEEALSRALK
jgi:alanyl-tRNA synthetase